MAAKPPADTTKSGDGEGRARRPSRRTVLGWTAGGAAAAGAALGASLAGEATAAQTARGIEGSWRVMVTVEDRADIPPFVLLATFSGDGTYVQNGTPLQSTGHGSWLRTGERTFAVTLEALLWDASSTVAVSILRARMTVELDPTGAAGVARFQFDVLLTNGEIIDVGSGMATAARISVQPL